MGASGLGQLLVEEGLLQEFDRRTIRRTSGNQACAFAKGIVALGLFDENQLAGFLTEFTKFDRVPKDFSNIIDLDTFSAIDPNLIMRLEVVPLKVDGRYLTVAIADPLDRTTIRQLEFFTGYKVRPMIATNQQIIDTIRQLIPSFQPIVTPLQKFLTNHVDAAAYHRRVRDMADPEILFEPPQAAEPVNFEAPRSDDNEFEELTLEDDFGLDSDPANDETELDLSGLESIEGDDNEGHLANDISDEDEPDLNLSSSQEVESDTDGDLGALDETSLEEATEEAEDDELNLDDDEADDPDVPEASTDEELQVPSPDTSSLSEDDELSDILSESVTNTEPTEPAPNVDEELEASDNLLDELEDGDTSPTEEVAQLVAETMEGTEGEATVIEEEAELTSEESDFIEEEASESNVELATADDLDDILSDIPESNAETVPGEEEEQPTINHLRAIADSAISDLNRAMISLSISSSKEDICEAFCRAVGSNIPVGAILLDRGGSIEPVCTWSDSGETLRWDGFSLSDPTVLSLSQFEPGRWANQKVEGLNLSDHDDCLVHLVANHQSRLYMVGQPNQEVSDAIRRHVSRMLKSIAKRL